MQPGDQLRVTDGKGNWVQGRISGNHKKQCTVTIAEAGTVKKLPRKISIAISLLKNTSRFEWFLEKATEIGIDEVIPLICARTEKHQFRKERLQGIMQSAMLQSQQVWLPDLVDPEKFDKALSRTRGLKDNAQKFIAHCNERENQLLGSKLDRSTDAIILIGPEGDFTADEIKLALSQGFISVSLGDTRLRTETAGIAAATLLRVI
jgi:16S rRNA (uracil1498-N3)-methyltransferase